MVRSMEDDLAFVGLGAMGAPMARNLLRAGHRVHVYDVRAAAVEALATDGAIAAGSAAEAARAARWVFVSLPDEPHVRTALLDPEDGAVAGASPGTLVTDLSTITPGAAREFAEALAPYRVGYLDAPVSGGVKGAADGTLSIMAGGTAGDFARSEPMLRVLGRTVAHVGPIGMGQLFKSCNQIICAMNLQAISEALALARAYDADLGQLREMLLGGAAGSWMLENLAPLMIDGDTSAGFRIELQLKDLRIAARAAAEAGVPLPGTGQVSWMYQEAIAHGEGGNGNQALFRVYDRLTGSPGSASPGSPP